MLTEEDIIKFYELLGRYDIKSPNVGIVGDHNKFRRFVKDIVKKYKDKKKDIRIICSDSGNKYTILVDDIEISYIKITTLHDLRGYKFRKYL